MGAVNGTGYSHVGGLVGSNWGSVSHCYSAGAVGGEFFLGGLVGSNLGTISKCHSTGAVSATDRFFAVGGLVGSNHWASNWDGRIGCCGRVFDSFWDIDASGLIDSSHGTGLTTAEMQTASTFLEAGWDFIDETENGTDDVWWILEGQDYPRLWWEAARGGNSDF